MVRYLVAAIPAVGAGSAPAEPSLQDYRLLRAANDAQLKAHLGGLLNGFEWANARLEVEKKPPLYCQPNGLILNPENAASIIDGQIRSGA